MIQPLHIKNAHIWNGERAGIRDLYVSDTILDKPAPDSQIVDLEGYTLYPGLINAHDHLELNHYPRSKFREVYDNAHQWGEDMNARLSDSPYRELRACPLEDRLFIGGLKNLLCGATTVAHHNPPHKPLFRKHFPVRVLRLYGWAHSLHFSSTTEILDSYHGTPKDTPWFIHLAEGADDVAAEEYERLKSLDAADMNTIVVHGVGLTGDDIMDAAPRLRGLVWCPSTNLYLLGKTANVRAWIGAGGLAALGSDSRLTADGDLLDEMRAAAATGRIEENRIFHMVTRVAAWMLMLEGVGTLQTGAAADFIALRDANSLCHSYRSDLALVVKGGVPQIGDPEMMTKFSRVRTVRATLDGVEKAVYLDLARRILKCSLQEPGLIVEPLPRRQFTIFGKTPN